MDSNPYSSPKEIAAPRRARSSIKRSILSVLLGGLVVDYVGSHIALVPVVIVATAATGSLDEAQEWLQTDTASLVSKGIGIVFSFFGGLTAACVAGHRQVLHAIGSTFIAVLVGMPSWIGRPGQR